jgi:hypothetical protein
MNEYDYELREDEPSEEDIFWYLAMRQEDGWT